MITLIVLIMVISFSSDVVFAACDPKTDPQCVLGNINPPPEIANLVSKGGAGGISFFLGVVVQLLYSVAGVAVVFMFIFGAFQLITSGGDKEAVSKARNRITYAVIGIVILALAFLILKLLGGVLNFQFFLIQP